MATLGLIPEAIHKYPQVSILPGSGDILGSIPCVF